MLSYVALRDKSASNYQVVVSSDLPSWAGAMPNITATSAVPIAGSDYETVTVAKQFFSIQAIQQ